MGIFYVPLERISSNWFSNWQNWGFEHLNIHISTEPRKDSIVSHHLIESFEFRCFFFPLTFFFPFPSLTCHYTRSFGDEIYSYFPKSIFLTLADSTPEVFTKLENTIFGKIKYASFKLFLSQIMKRPWSESGVVLSLNFSENHEMNIRSTRKF